MLEIQTLIDEIQEEAKRAEFPLDEPIYQKAGAEPTQPILYAGNLQSQLCVFGRDLGKDEVATGQPLYGAAGSLVRKGLYRTLFNTEARDKTELEKVLDQVLLTNTVPYKPPGNKAYSTAVKQRFRPYIERLLVCHWQGDRIITLGNDAFDWFSPYAPKGTLKEFFQRGDRYSSSQPITLQAKDSQGNLHQRSITLLPLPHPSPLNQRYYAQFPQLLQQRLNGIFQ
ncbi:uracil-DNA glycosylase [Laspinema sp. A4]|uniref:uracil-DNA glycosylase family protein n=1 Tax=Laspinema sp. D2d TaxID=2953686 RepID=UPI0021BAFF08|nr:uracil-DNA glycosylase family protein [Laspinema sp. D2d]MCT7986612.1 uracil-DNA glycosylase [Laspinema sp. D2d]